MYSMGDLERVERAGKDLDSTGNEWQKLVIIYYSSESLARSFIYMLIYLDPEQEVGTGLVDLSRETSDDELLAGEARYEFGRWDYVQGRLIVQPWKRYLVGAAADHMRSTERICQYLPFSPPMHRKEEASSHAVDPPCLTSKLQLNYFVCICWWPVCFMYVLWSSYR